MESYLNLTMAHLLAGAISTPSDSELIIGLILLVIVLIGISLTIGWLLSRLFAINEGKRKKAFRVICLATLTLLIASLAGFYFYFIA